MIDGKRQPKKVYVGETTSAQKRIRQHLKNLGYDLNYAGVIIGPDLRVDPLTGEIVADRGSYRDKKGKETTGHLKDAFGDDELLIFIRNVYGVLLTRGMLGTYVYVCDPALRERVRATFDL